MVSFPPESPDDAHIAPVTYLRTVQAPSEPPAGSRQESAAAHPSRGRTVRGVVAFPRADSAAAAAAADAGAASAGSEGNSRVSADKQTTRASNVSIHQLARRGMSRWELEQVLEKREIEPDIARAELDRLESVGLLDDAALAVSLVYTQHSRKGLGRTAIEQELRRRHIAPELIESALAEIADEDELERATELALKRVGQLSSYDDETAKRRLHGFLARKGYSSDVVRQALDAALATRGRRGVRFQ